MGPSKTRRSSRLSFKSETRLYENAAHLSQRRGHLHLGIKGTFSLGLNRKFGGSIGAGRETSSLAGKHHQPEGRIELKALQPLLQILREIAVDGVEGGRPVQGNPQNLLFSFHQNEGYGQGLPPLKFHPLLYHSSGCPLTLVCSLAHA